MDIIIVGLLFGGFFFVSGAKTYWRAIGWSLLYIGLVILCWIGLHL